MSDHDPDSVVDEPEPDVLALELTGRWVRDDRFFRAAHRARFIGGCRTPELAELVVQEHNAALAARRLEPIAWPASGVPADRSREVGAGGRGRKFISAADPGADLSDIDVLICPDDVDVVLGLVTSEQVARSVREDCASCGRALYRTPDPRTAGLPVTCLVCAVGEERAADARQAAAPACPHCGATAAVPLSSGLRCTNRWHEVRR